MNIMEYDLNNLDIEELDRIFRIFKENSEKEGHTAIAIPKDQTIYQDVDKKTLCYIKDIIEKEIEKKNKEEDNEYRKTKLNYIGKCFEDKNKLVKIVDFNPYERYSMKCICLEWEKDKRVSLWFENILLFACNGYPGTQLVDLWKEISTEEFETKFKEKINKICFGEYRCQE